MSDTRVHPVTGEVLRRDVRAQTIRAGSLTRTVDVPGWYPMGDGDAIHSGADLQAWEEALKALQAAYATRIRAVRRKLKLTQEEAGIVIGGGKRAFQKYESAKLAPSEAAIGLIEVLDRHPEVIETLRRARASGSEASTL